MKNIRATYTRYEPAKSLDYYATDPKAADYLLAVETFSHTVWEPACGGLHLSKRIEKHGYRVINSDIVQRAENVTELDFLNYYPKEKNELDIITNPPYNKAAEFIKHALDISRGGVKVAMFLKLTFLEGKKRKPLFKRYPPKTLYVSSSRIICAKNGDFDKISSSATAYGWFVWEKGHKADPVIKWIN